MRKVINVIRITISYLQLQTQCKIEPIRGQIVMTYPLFVSEYHCIYNISLCVIVVYMYGCL